MLPSNELRIKARTEQYIRQFLKSRYPNFTEDQLEETFNNRKYVVQCWWNNNTDEQNWSINERIGKAGIVGNEFHIFDTLEEAEEAMEIADASFIKQGLERNLSIDIYSKDRIGDF